MKMNERNCGQSQFFQLNGIRLHALVSGPEAGPLVLLLHGFPQFSFTWRHQIQALSDAGYRVIAPDLRGYNLSDKPKTIESYSAVHIIGDVLALIKSQDKSCILIGHDFGGTIALELASLHPELVEKLIILNAPHPYVIAKNLRKNRKQFLKSWYILFFQIPIIPEILLQMNDFRLLIWLITRRLRPDLFTKSDLNHYRKAWSMPHAFASMLHWYRAALRVRAPKPFKGRITVHTLILWGIKDLALTEALAEETLRFCEKGELIKFQNLSHWLPEDDPSIVNQSILQFLGTVK